eukprot:30041-Pelagococcus_subviridis.AAC.10
MPPYHSTSTVTIMGIAVRQNVYPTTYLASIVRDAKSAETCGSAANARIVLTLPRLSSATSVASASAFCRPYTFDTTTVGGNDASVTAVSGHDSASMKHNTPITFTAFRSMTLMLSDSAFETVLQSLFRRDDRSPVLFRSKKPTSCRSTASNSRRRTRAFNRAICTVNTLPRSPAKIPARSAAINSETEYRRNAAASRSMATASTKHPVKCGTEGHSIQANVGVEFIGVSWRSKASRTGIERKGWAERHAGKSP